MASINPFPDDSAGPLPGQDSGSLAAKARGAGARDRVVRRRSRANKAQARGLFKNQPGFPGFPDYDGLKPILGFICIPAFLVLAITITGGHWPRAVLYPIAICLGAFVALSTFRTLELVLACLLIYLPFSKVFVVPLAPGINGTNMLILLALFAALLRLGDRQFKLNDWPQGTTLVFLFGILTSLSAVTITLEPGGRNFLLYHEFWSYKAWVDQFIFYFVLLMAIRDTQTAKRCVVYVVIGAVLVVLYAVPEMFEKMGRSSIDKSRIGGPHLQSNNFGGFVAYTALPLIGMFVVYIKDIRTWVLTPYFLLTAKVLITTFSRGAYVAMFVGGLLAGWYKGRGFLMMWLSLLFCTLLIFPSLIPDSMVIRMESVTSEDAGSSPTEERLDKSSSTRLVLWGAAMEMISEDPIWGKGFKGYQLLKADYTETAVSESDPHSMYLYIASQMGIPSLILFVLILAYSFYLGRLHSQCNDDLFIRAIGVGGAAATGCFAVVCIFGSRAVSLNFSVYFFTLLAVMQVIKFERDKQRKVLKHQNGRHHRDNRQALPNIDQQASLIHKPAESPKRLRRQANTQYLSKSSNGSSRRGRRTAQRGAAAYQERQLLAAKAAQAQPVPPDSSDSASSDKTATQQDPASTLALKRDEKRLRKLPGAYRRHSAKPDS